MDGRHKTLAAPWMRLAAGAMTLLLGAAQALAQAEQPEVTDSGSLYSALWTIGIFVVLLAVLGKFAWKPVLRAVQQREAHIADAVARAEASQARSEEMLAECADKLRQAEETAEKRLAEAAAAAEQAKAEILAAARNQAHKMTQRAAAEIESARQVAEDELYEFAAELATVAASKIIAKQLDVEAQRHIIAESLQQIRERAVRT